MFSSVILSTMLLFPAQTTDFPTIWKKVEGEWSYVGQVKEKVQVHTWIEKKTKSHFNKILIKEVKRMPFIILTPTKG
jgi:hypothetical protein